MNSHRVPFLYFLLGSACGFLLNAALDEHSSAAGVKLIFVAGIIFISLFWKKIEASLHQSVLAQWNVIRTKGKWFFIIMRFGVLRSLIFMTLFIGPFLALFGIRPGNFMYIAFVIIVIELVMLYLGYEEWNSCEQEYEIICLRNAATIEKISTAIKN